MTVRLNPYLHFQGTAREALTFYQSVLGGDLVLTSFEDLGLPVDEAEKANIMHGHLKTGGGLDLMAADTPSSMQSGPVSGVTMSLSGDDDATLSRYWEGLSVGGTVDMPFEVAAWGAKYGQCTDQYGITWMINVGPEGS